MIFLHFVIFGISLVFLRVLAGEHYNGNYHPNFNNKYNMHSEYTYGKAYGPGRNVEAFQTLPAEKNSKYNTGNGENYNVNYQPDFNNKHNMHSKYNYDPEKTMDEMGRHYINIQGDSLHGFGKNGPASDSSDFPVFELGPSSKDFIIEQVDKIMMTLNLMAIKDNKEHEIEEKVYINNKKNTNNKKNHTNIKKTTQAKDCSQLYNKGNTTLKYSQIFPYSCCPTKNLTVQCDQAHDGGRWTVIQKRGAYFKKAKRADFNRTWDDYVKGFGKLTLNQDGEYWIGLEAVHDLTSGANQELFISLEDHASNKRWAKYKQFTVGGPDTNYKLTVGGYSGDAGDSLKYHNNQYFSTFDKDNDQLGMNCAAKYSGGWWFRGCQRSNLNGVHAFAPGNPTENGIIWASFKGFDISLHSVTMKIRPVTPKKSK